MSFVLKLWQLWVVGLAGWINQQQHDVIEYLRTENGVLKETHSKKRIIVGIWITWRPVPWAGLVIGVPGRWRRPA